MFGGNGHNVYIPCEIQFIAKGIFVNENFVETIRPFILPTMIINTHVTEQFAQDPAILLKHKDTNADCAIIVKDGLDLSYIPSEQRIKINFTSGNDYGGNFISSPPTVTHPFGYVFTFSSLNQQLSSFLDQHLCQPVISLSCSFRYDDERHIDECMCFMPYGTQWKVWFYYIRNVKYSLSLEKMYRQVAENKDELITKLQELSKMNVAPELCNLIINKLNNVEIDELRYNQLYTSDLRKIKNRVDGNLKIILEMLNSSSKATKFSNLDAITETLKSEHLTNLSTVSNALFGTPYSENKDKFVFFPLDIELTDTFKFRIVNIPVFNRLWYENDTECCLLLSTNSVIDPEIATIMEREITSIKSCINPAKKLHFAYIDTSKYNSMGNVGGNLHCLVKTVY